MTLDLSGASETSESTLSHTNSNKATPFNNAAPYEHMGDIFIQTTTMALYGIWKTVRFWCFLLSREYLLGPKTVFLEIQALCL